MYWCVYSSTDLICFFFRQCWWFGVSCSAQAHLRGYSWQVSEIIILSKRCQFGSIINCTHLKAWISESRYPFTLVVQEKVRVLYCQEWLSSVYRTYLVHVDVQNVHSMVYFQLKICPTMERRVSCKSITSYESGFYTHTCVSS